MQASGVPRRRPGRPKGAKNKKTLVAEAIHHGLEGFVKEEMPKVVMAVFEQAHEGNLEAAKLLFNHFLVKESDRLRVMQQAKTKVTVKETADGRREKTTEQSGLSITFEVVGGDEDEDEPVDIEGERLE